jgi:hypothetical protein
MALVTMSCTTSSGTENGRDMIQFNSASPYKNASARLNSLLKTLAEA